MTVADQSLESRARKFLESRLEPDPNHPDEDTFALHFPRACELVEGREFWAGHLSELLAAFAGEVAADCAKIAEEWSDPLAADKYDLADVAAAIRSKYSPQAEKGAAK